MFANLSKAQRSKDTDRSNLRQFYNKQVTWFSRDPTCEISSLPSNTALKAAVLTSVASIAPVIWVHAVAMFSRSTSSDKTLFLECTFSISSRPWLSSQWGVNIPVKKLLGTYYLCSLIRPQNKWLNGCVENNSLLIFSRKVVHGYADCWQEGDAMRTQ